MSPLRLILSSLYYYWPANLAVACGVAVGAAVLSGALLVGDSMRGSLTRLALDRLGRIDEALVTDRFFRAKLADELAAGSGAEREPLDTAPAILLRVSLENPSAQSPVRANRVELVGCDERFWRLGSGRPRHLPGPREIVLSKPLADRLSVRPGDAVLLRLPKMGPIPAESALGKKQETIHTERLAVSEIIAAEGLGRFGLWPTQRPPQNAYVSLGWLQQRMDQPGLANAILVANRESDATNSRRLTAAGSTSAACRPRLADYGLRAERTASGYWNITSDRMLLSPATERAVLQALACIGREGRTASEPPSPFPLPPSPFALRPSPFLLPSSHLACQPAFSYLANTLAGNGREIPYSTITAIDFADRVPLGPFVSPEGKPLMPLGPGEIALNSWAADQLRAKVGDTVRVAYFEPESAAGQVREGTVALRLAAVVKLSGAADDRALVPAVKGMTDQSTMTDGDPPFPFDAKRIRPADEAYWRQHGPTPKAFVSLATGRRLWGSRFGQTTSIRVAEERSQGSGARGQGQEGTEDRGPRSHAPRGNGLTGRSASAEDARSGHRADNAATQSVGPSVFPRRAWEQDVAGQLEQAIDPAAMEFVFQPVRSQAVAAAAGTTPFGVLFLGFSFFLIAAAVMLVALLFRLGAEQRARQIGMLLAVGLSPRQVGRLLLAEGALVAAAGSLLGAPLGIGYAALMLCGLRTWWLPAIGTPFLRLQLTAASLAIGCAAGLATAMIALWLSVRAIGRVPPRRLLAGQPTREGRGGGHERRLAGQKHWFGGLLLLLSMAIAAAVLAVEASQQALGAGTFFAAGAIALVALSTWVWLRLRVGMTGPAVVAGRGNLLRLAVRNAARNPTRSALSIGLVAAASFLIVATSVFRIDSGLMPPALNSGNGGFALLAESDQPILHNLDTPAGRKQLGFSAADEKLFDRSTIIPLRAAAGDDASCQNLYRVRRPRVLGIPPRLADQDGFAWAQKPGNAANPWLLLDQAGKMPAPQGETPAPQQRGKMPPLRSVPVILEKNTANYALGLWGGVGETFSIPDGRGRTIELQVVGLLADSILQGDLLIGEQDFLRCFPESSGHRLFLVETPPRQTAAVRAALERELGDYGLAAETTGQRLADFLTVQNTYLATFQSLGGLGLLLGTFGLAAVQLRNVLERRGELALLRATGFRRRTLAGLVLMEHAALLAAGLGIGTTAALVAVLPHWFGRAASLPWASLAGTLAAVLAAGLAAGGLAVRASLGAPLLAALREEPA